MRRALVLFSVLCLFGCGEGGSGGSGSEVGATNPNGPISEDTRQAATVSVYFPPERAAQKTVAAVSPLIADHARLIVRKTVTETVCDLIYDGSTDTEICDPD